MKTQFVLASRFNWPHKVWDTRSEQAYRDWVQNRLELFRNLTVPSVRNSYGELDRWLIMIDPRIVDIREDLTEMTRGLPVRLVEYKGRDLATSIQMGLSDLDYPARVMTCRLDTDDLIGAGMISGYRAAEITEDEARDGVVLSFPGGAVYSAAEEKFYFSNYPENPFLCYVEECAAAEDIRTVYQAMHVDMLDRSPHARILRAFLPQWASVVHGDNVANQSLLGGARFSYAETDELKAYFGIRGGR